MEPIVHQARTHGFGKGWLAALQTMGVIEDSPLRNPEQIPYPAPVPPVQSQANAADEKETLSMRELPLTLTWKWWTSKLPATFMLRKDKDKHLQPTNQPGMRPPTESMNSHKFRLPTCPLNLHVFVSRLSSIYLISLSITLVCPLPPGCGGRTIALTLISPSFLFLKSLGCGDKTLV